MKFGISLQNYGPTNLPDTMLRIAQAAEQAGFDSAWVSGHVMVPQRYGPVFGRNLEALISLAYVAGVTKRLLLGTSILLLPQRDPILTAKQVASVDQLSNGRMILGIGVGWMEEQYRYFREDFKKRGRITNEWILALRTLWRDDPASFHGQWLNFDDAYFQPKPIQPGGPPIAIGGASDAALRRAATLGDEWHASGMSPADVAAGVAKLRQWANGRPVTISLRAYVTLSEAFRDDPDILIGGQPAAFIDRLGEYAGAGVEHVVFGFAYRTVEDILAQLETLATDVMPAFR